jgi:hypothetical protein
MTTIDRLRVSWTGFSGGPGVSTFFATAAADLMGPLNDWLFSMANNIPPDVTLTIEPEVDQIEDTTGVLVDSAVITPGDARHGIGDAVYAAPVGLVSNWLTSTVVDGHRLRGRTYVVPLSGTSFDSAGNLESDVHTSLAGASDTLVTAAGGSLLVWHRPKHGAGGVSAPVTSAFMPALAAILTSRRI